MILEVLLFRSLFRNTSAEVSSVGPRVTYFSSKWLWVFALTFHYCFLVIFIRHFRFFIEPIPVCLTWLEFVDGIMQMGVPRLFMTDMLIVVAVLFLFGRRLANPKVRYISLANDYFPLFLIMGIVGTGICMRYFDKVDVAQAKVFIMGVLHFTPQSAVGLNPLFFTHVALVSVLLIYFPFSKLMHMGGIFMSPTRNMRCNTREVRHVNPWNNPNAFLPVVASTTSGARPMPCMTTGLFLNTRSWWANFSGSRVISSAMERFIQRPPFRPQGGASADTGGSRCGPSSRKCC